MPAGTVKRLASSGPTTYAKELEERDHLISFYEKQIEEMKRTIDRLTDERNMYESKVHTLILQNHTLHEQFDASQRPVQETIIPADTSRNFPPQQSSRDRSQDFNGVLLDLRSQVDCLNGKNQQLEGTISTLLSEMETLKRLVSEKERPPREQPPKELSLPSPAPAPAFASGGSEAFCIRPMKVAPPPLCASNRRDFHVAQPQLRITTPYDRFTSDALGDERDNLDGLGRPMEGKYKQTDVDFQSVVGVRGPVEIMIETQETERRLLRDKQDAVDRLNEELHRLRSESTILTAEIERRRAELFCAANTLNGLERMQGSKSSNDENTPVPLVGDRTLKSMTEYHNRLERNSNEFALKQQDLAQKLREIDVLQKKMNHLPPTAKGAVNGHEHRMSSRGLSQLNSSRQERRRPSYAKACDTSQHYS
jgi:prefoldin subunit 5